MYVFRPQPTFLKFELAIKTFTSYKKGYIKFGNLK